MTHQTLARLWLSCFALSLQFGAAAADFEWHIPKAFPRPVVPADNPMTAAKVTLGRYLFYDKRMSVNGQQSCGSCHRQELAFTDGRSRAQGSTGELHPRSAMSLVNVAYVPKLTWANPTLELLEQQALTPMLSEHPVELGLKGRENDFLAAVRSDSLYQLLFREAFPQTDAAVSLENVNKAIACFERSIVSMRSPYDRYRWGGDAGALSESAKQGEIIFDSSERGGCFQCHGGWNFSSVRFAGGVSEGGHEFFNTGATVYDAPNRGVYESTNKAEDLGKFRAPTLRNIAVTAPYMHDGSLQTLEQVVDHYAAGGKVTNSNQSRIIRPLRLTAGDKRDLIEFLKSLTDEELLRDPRWSDPWKH